MFNYPKYKIEFDISGYYCIYKKDNFIALWDYVGLGRTKSEAEARLLKVSDVTYYNKKGEKI